METRERLTPETAGAHGLAAVSLNRRRLAAQSIRPRTCGLSNSLQATGTAGVCRRSLSVRPALLWSLPSDHYRSSRRDIYLFITTTKIVVTLR